MRTTISCFVLFYSFFFFFFRKKFYVCNLITCMTENWHFSLYGCCADRDAHREVAFCDLCQMSRQYHFLLYGVKVSLPTPFCVVLHLCWCFIVCGCSARIRRLARTRYGIPGSSCGDYCLGVFCLKCSHIQILREMVYKNDFPGACCYVAACSVDVG